MQGMVDNLGCLQRCISGGWEEYTMQECLCLLLYKRGQEGTLFPDWKDAICGIEVPLLVLGDPAYLLLSWLMQAIPDNILPAKDLQL